MKKWMWLLPCVTLLAGCLTCNSGAYSGAEKPANACDTVSLQAADTVIDFGKVTLPQNATAFAAVYDADGRMLYFSAAVLSSGSTKLSVPDAVYTEMDTAKLFRLDSTGYTPVGGVITKTKQTRSDIETPLF